MNDPDLDTLNLNDLMMFDASNDRIEPTDLLDMGQSELIGRIANRWGVSIDEVLLNIKMRAQIKGIIAEAGRTRPELVEGDMVGQANNMFWLMMDELQEVDGGVYLGGLYGRWCGWYGGFYTRESIKFPKKIFKILN